MPHNSCTIILNGHGGCNPYKTMDLRVLNINYNLVFIKEAGESVSTTENNMLLDKLYVNTVQSLIDVEAYPTTYRSEQNIVPLAPAGYIDMTEHATPYLQEHYLSNAIDVRNACTLLDFNQQGGARFVEQNNIYIDYNGPRAHWDANGSNCSFIIQYDSQQVINDVLAAYNVIPPPVPGSSISLSQNNIIYLTPTAVQGESFTVSLSDLVTDIIQKIKICILYTPPQNQQQAIVDISAVVLDDNTVPNLAQILFPNAAGNDVYHEVIIGADANIIWDSCRDIDLVGV